MKRERLFIILFLILTSCLERQWGSIKSEECVFSVDFPGEPKISNRITEVEFGRVNLQYYIYDAQNSMDDNYLYLAGHMLLPDSVVKSYGIEEFFNSAIKRSVSGFQGKIKSVKTITYMGFPGREVKMDFKSGDSVITLRVYLIGNEEFMVETMTKPTKDYNYSQKKFFDSFKILKIAGSGSR